MERMGHISANPFLTRHSRNQTGLKHQEIRNPNIDPAKRGTKQILHDGFVTRESRRGGEKPPHPSLPLEGGGQGEGVAKVFSTQFEIQKFKTTKQRQDIWICNI
jgi:hypothetical protein